MRKPNKLVALCVNISGGCEYVATVKNITESEYAELLYQQRQHEQARQKEKQELKETIKELTDRISQLEKEIKVLKGEDDYEESIEN